MKAKPKQVTYVGIHNRRTDHLKFMREKVGMTDLEELGKQYFMDGMEYFRYCIFLILVMLLDHDDIKCEDLEYNDALIPEYVIFQG